MHFGPTRYTYRHAWVLDDGRRCVDRRAGDVHTGYERHARQLDEAHHSHIADPAARPIFLRLTVRVLALKVRSKRFKLARALSVKRVY